MKGSEPDQGQREKPSSRGNPSGARSLRHRSWDGQEGGCWPRQRGGEVLQLLRVSAEKGIGLFSVTAKGKIGPLKSHGWQLVKSRFCSV